MSKNEDFFQCRCHPDWKGGEGLHRVPVDCETRSREQVEKDNKIIEKELAMELRKRKGRKYKNWKEEFKDKWGTDKKVGGWFDWSMNENDPDKIINFIKNTLNNYEIPSPNKTK